MLASPASLISFKFRKQSETEAISDNIVLTVGCRYYYSPNPNLLIPVILVSINNRELKVKTLKSGISMTIKNKNLKDKFF